MGVYAGTVNADGSIIIDTRIDTKGADKGVTGLKKQFTSLSSAARKLGAVIGLAFSVTAAVQFGKEASQAAREASDALVGLRSILEGQGRSFADAQQFINEYTEDGLIPATNAITAYKNLAMRGYDDSQIRQVMVALKDASAYGRQASYTMGEAVQSATEGLKNENSILVDNAGVTKNVAKMWEEYAASIGTTSNNLTQQQKIQAEVTGILTESKYQTGDAAKVANTLSGQLQQLSFNFNNLKIAVGNIINPFVQSFLPVINSAISAITRFANTIATVVNTLFGTKLGEFSETLQSVSGGYESAAEGADDLAASTDKACKAAKKSLAGFDEITKISKESAFGPGSSGGASSSVSSGGNITVGGAVSEDAISPAVKAAVERIQKYLEPLKSIDFAPIKSTLAGLGEQFSLLGDTVSSSLGWAWNTVLVPFAAWAAESLLPEFVNLLASAVGALNEMLIALQPFGIWLWENFLKPISEWTGDAVIAGLQTLSGLLTDFGTWVSNNKQLVESMAIVVGSFAAAWSLVNAAITTWNTVAAIASGVTVALGSAVAFLTSPIGIVTAAIAALVAGVALLAANWDEVSEVATNVWAAITEAWGGAASWFDDHIWTPISNGFKGLVNGVIAFVNGLVSAFCQGMNFVISGLNKLSFDVPDWVPVIGGETFGFNLSTIKAPQIPYLAKGAVIPPNAPFYAVLGDQRHGRNLEAPESLIRQILQEEIAGDVLAGAEAVVERLERLIGTVEGIEIGDTTIGESAERYQRKMRIARG